MIVIETSAILAILQEEVEAPRFIEAARTNHCVASAVTVYEAAVVINARRGAQGVSNLLEFIEASGIEIRLFSVDMISVAIAAYQKYGKGTGAKARLNLGDCAAYALAKSLDVPLLFKGNDFTATDLRSAMA